MPKTQTRIAGSVAALLAAGLAGFSLRSSPSSPTALAARNPAADVRTQVIRRTIHIVRHEHARRGARPYRLTSVTGGGVGAHPASAVRTRASASHAAGSAATAAAGTGAVTTRTSASHSVGSSAAGSGSSSAPVTTRTSASHSAGSPAGGSGSSPGHVTTRTSSHGSSSSGTGHVATRSSGGGGDGGDGGGNGD